MNQEWEIAGGVIVGESSIQENQVIHIEKSLIKDISTKTKDIPRINLNGMYVYPGFINAHDHLLGTYLPKIGTNAPYLSWLAWDNDLKSSAVFAERQQLEPEQLYLLGAYRHLFCGVTTVMDHIPHAINSPFTGNIPIRLVEKYTLNHSICSYSLGWGKDIATEYAEAQKNNIPYVTHIAEGLDEESIKALSELEKHGGLGEFSVLVHGLAFSPQDILQTAKKKASMVWCPASNQHIFHKTSPIKEMLDAGINVCLGTDNPLSGSLNLFEEIKTAREIYLHKYNEELPAETVFRMITSNPAKALKLDRLGSLITGNKADLVVLTNNYNDPYTNLCNAGPEDVKLVVIDGKPVYGDLSLQSLFDQFELHYESVKIGISEKLVIGSPKKLLDSINKTLGYKKSLAFLPIIY